MNVEALKDAVADDVQSCYSMAWDLMGYGTGSDGLWHGHADA